MVYHPPFFRDVNYSSCFSDEHCYWTKIVSTSLKKGGNVHHSSNLHLSGRKPVHRGVFCQFLFWWNYYGHCSKSTGKETGKTHPCAAGWKFPQLSVSFLRKWFGQQKSGWISAIILWTTDFSFLVNLLTQETLLRPFFFFIIMFFQSWN